MINRKKANAGINANLSLEPNSAAQSNNNFTSTVYIATPYPDGTKLPEVSTFITRDTSPPDEPAEKLDVRSLILETYARILLDQDKALISNLISKRTIIVPYNDLVAIIKCVTGGEVDVIIDEDPGCCTAKVSLIHKIDAIKIHTDSGEIITDFKTVYNKQWNELVNSYHLNLKYVC